MSKFLYVAVLLYGNSILCCEEGNRHRIKGASCQYADCQNGIWVLTECQSHLTKTRNKSCDNAICSDSVAKCSENSFYSHYSDNTAYYECADGRLLLKYCREQEAFDTKTNVCKIMPSYEIENKNNNLPEADQSRIFKRETEGCKNGEQHIKKGSCKSYFKCANGKEILSRCSDCQNYDEKKNKCRYVFNTPCHKTPVTSSPDKGTTESNPTQSDRYTSQTVPDHSNRTPGYQSITSQGPTSEMIPSNPTPEANPTEHPQPTGNSTTDLTEPDHVTKPDPFTVNPDERHTSETDQGTTSARPPTSECVRKALPNCKYYLECQDGELLTKKCGWFQHFDSKSSSCAFIQYKCHEGE